jgi:signal transduction histidine kinase
VRRPGPHLLDPKRRLRDRLLAAMLALALLPLGIFTLLVAAGIGSMSRATTDETHRAIVEDQRARLQGQVEDRAEAIDSRLAGIAGLVHGLRDLATSASAHPAALAGPVTGDHGLAYATGGDGATTVVVGASASAGDPAQRAARIADPGGTLVARMADLRARYPEVESVWVADSTGGAVRSVPALDVPAAVAAGRITATSPLGRASDAVLASSQGRMASGDSNPDAWPRSGGRGTGPYWTDPYATRQSGGQGITVWMPAGDGTLRVGADILLAPLTDLLLQGQVAGEPGAYPLIVSSSNTVIAASEAATPDFGAATPAVGALLPVPASNRQLVDGIADVERSGRPAVINATLSGTSKLLFAADVDTPHWILISAVPAADLEPDTTGLQKGIERGIHDIFWAAVPIVLVLIVLAVVLASVLARRMVRPVRALTQAAERLAAGHTDETVPPQGSDEVGVLAASLERMRREINASRDAILAASRELEGRVADRTLELRLRNEELVALNELAGSLTRSLDPETIIEGGLEAIRAVLPVREARGYSLEDGELRPVSAVLGRSAGGAEALEGVAGDAIAGQQLVMRAVHGGALIGLPMATSRGALGGIGLMSATLPSPETRTLLVAIANQMGLALRTARLSAEGREMAVLQERTRLAREIHDTLAQQLTGIVLQLEAAEAFVERDAGRAGRTVAEARNLARAALAEARRSVWDLRPTPLSDSGVVAAVTLEVERFGERTGMSARMRAEGMKPPPPLEPQSEVALLRIVQQALTNIADHSSATKVSVRLRRDGDSVELVIRDNGRGFDAAAERTGSFGIIGMAERARLSGGEFQVDSRPGRGTVIRARLPITADASVKVGASA